MPGRGNEEEKGTRMEAAHEATATPSGDGFLVECPEGCNLRLSRNVPDEKAAEWRIALHRMTTAALVPQRGKAAL